MRRQFETMTKKNSALGENTIYALARIKLQSSLL
jgi:hypothetical protein